MKPDTKTTTENGIVEDAKRIIESANLIMTSVEGDGQISLYGKGEKYYMVYFQENEIVKAEMISRMLAHMQFPNLIIR